MERQLVGFCIFLITFAVGVCVVNPRLVFLEPEKEWKWFIVMDEEIQKPE